MNPILEFAYISQEKKKLISKSVFSISKCSGIEGRVKDGFERPE